jgi:GNAT superfamily N-acetyltransferase
MVIRTARDADAGAIAELSGQLGYPTTTEEMAERLAKLARAGGGVVLVADVGGRVVGWLHIVNAHRVEYAPYAEITGLVVDERHRGAGVGRTLLEAAERWASEQGFDTVRVRSNIVRARAHEFYCRHGYEQQKQQAVFAKRVIAP